MTKRNNCIILANGAFPTSADLIADLRRCECIIACDGAVNRLVDAGILPHHIVGDLDSLDPGLRIRFDSILFHNPDQETNDLTKAVRFAQSKGIRKVRILGATGLREDHTLGNISLLTQYADIFDEVSMVSDYGTFVPIRKTTTFPSTPGQQISLFAIFPFGSISTHGLRYPIHERNLPVWWEGTLNETAAESFTIELKGDGHVLVYFARG